MPNAPLITQVSYNGTSVSVWWTASSDPEVIGYTLNVLYDSATVVFSGVVNGATKTFGSIPLDSYQLDANVAYFVQVTTIWSSGPGQDESSQLVPLITQLPELETVAYDGSNLNFTWKPTPQAVQGYLLKAMQVGGGSTFQATLPSPSASQGSIPAASLPPGGLGGQAWQVAVCALGNIASNDPACFNVSGCTPWVALPDPLPALQCTGAAYSEDAGLTVTWTPLTAGITGYLLAVTSPQDGTRYTLEVAGMAAGSATLRFPQKLSPEQTYTLQVFALDSLGAGVSTALIPLITTPPTLSSVVYNQAGSGTIDLTWEPLTNPAIASFELEVYSVSGAAASYPATVQGGSAGSGQVPVPKGGFNASQAWAARVTAVGGIVSAVGDRASVYVVPPALTMVACDGESISAAWAPMTGPWYRPPEGFLLTLAASAGGPATASAFIPGALAGCGKIQLPGPSGCVVQVTAVGGISTGPASTAVPPIIQAPSPVNAATDVLTNQTTLTWTAVANATAYLLSFSTGGTPVTVTGTTYPLPAGVLNPGSPLSVTLVGKASSTGLEVSGPAGGPFALPAMQPMLLSAEYNGLAASFAWLPVAGASGYTATVLSDTGGTLASVASASVPASTAAVRIPFTAAKGKSYTAVVQACFNAVDVGPVSAALPLFTPAFFPSETSAQTCYPFVYPASTLDVVLDPDNAKTGEPILLYLPDIGSGTALKNLPYTQGAFTLAANGGANSAAYPYTLGISNTVATNNPWSFGTVPPANSPAAIRQGLRSDYIAFLQGAETNGAVAWGIGYLQQIIARLLPQTFAELLYYNFGLSFPDAAAGISIGSVDLRPGMVLRVAVNPYQIVAGQSSSLSSWYNGFVGGTEIDYDVGSMMSNGGQWSIGFDNFIGQLVANGALTVDPPPTNRAGTNSQEAGGADAADLYFPGFTGPFYRLFVPAKLLSPTGTVGNSATTANFVLAPATTYAGLMATGNTLTSSGNVLGYFRGRTLLKACVRVRCNGMAMVVPIGTTVGNLLERAGCLPPAANMPLAGITLRRNLGGAVLDPSAPLSPSESSVRLDWSSSASQLYGPNWDLLSMPLLSGDSVLFPVPVPVPG